jgi:membrane protein DedA with SNARE-associated domain
MLASLLATYGYIAVFVGTFLEGETILVLGGFAAKRGFLDLPWVIICAFLGSLFGDQLYYFIGRYKGINFIMRRPVWRQRSERVFSLMQKHQTLLILGFRFLYGIRNVTPFLIGASGIQPLRFCVLNIISAFIWAVSVGFLGYMFGQAFELVLKEIKQYELLAFGAIILIGIIIWLIRWFYKRRTS